MIYHACCLHLLRPGFLDRAGASPNLPRLAGYGHPQPVGLKLGGKLLDTQEVVTNKVVAAAVRRQRFRLRLTKTGFIQVSLNMR